jgi:hypothetical protein
MGSDWRARFLAVLAITGILTPVGYAEGAGRSQGADRPQELAGKLGALEERSYVASKAHDRKFWASFLSDKFVAWGGSGRLDKRSAVRVLSGVGCRISSYRLTDIQVSQLTLNAAVLTHKTEVTGTCGGERLAPTYYTVTVYVRESGQWKAAFRAQSRIVDPMKATRPAASDLWAGGPTRSDASTQTSLAREQAVWSAWKNHDKAPRCAPRQSGPVHRHFRRPHRDAPRGIENMVGAGLQH